MGSIYFLKRKIESTSKPKKKRAHPEADDQMALVTFCSYHLGRLISSKRLKFTHAPNGGSRNVLEALQLKKMGVSRGTPDLLFFFPNGKFGGLAIEMKSINGGKLSEEQKEWLDYLNSIGWLALEAKGFHAAKDIVIEYFKDFV